MKKTKVITITIEESTVGSGINMKNDSSMQNYELLGAITAIKVALEQTIKDSY